MKRFAFLALWLGLCACAWAADPPVTYVRAGKLLDVRSGKMLTDQVIVIRGEKMIMDMTTGVSRIESGKGRVDALIKPNAPPGGQPGNAPSPGAKEAKPSAPMKIN